MSTSLRGRPKTLIKGKLPGKQLSSNTACNEMITFAAGAISLVDKGTDGMHPEQRGEFGLG